MPLPDLAGYSHLIYSLPERYSAIRSSTLVLIPIGSTLAKLEGQVNFEKDIVLDVWELVDLEVGRIRTYSYEIYRSGEKVSWYDPFEHPEISELATTFPHHQHVLPDLRRNRIPAPGLSFDSPNLPYLIEEIERSILSGSFEK